MALTTVRSTGISSLPAISAANLTSIPAANITGTLPAISGANLTGVGVAGITSSSTSGTAITIDSNNIVVPNVPAFRASSTSTWENGTAYGETVKFNVCTSGGNNIQRNHDNLGNFNTSTYTFTAPVDGTYYLYCCMYVHYDEAEARYCFWINGSTLKNYDTSEGSFYSQQAGGSSLDNNFMYTTTIELAANDAVNVRSTLNSPYSSYYGKHCYFGGYLLGKKR